MWKNIIHKAVNIRKFTVKMHEKTMLLESPKTTVDFFGLAWPSQHSVIWGTMDVQEPLWNAWESAPTCTHTYDIFPRQVRVVRFHVCWPPSPPPTAWPQLQPLDRNVPRTLTAQDQSVPRHREHRIRAHQIQPDSR